MTTNHVIKYWHKIGHFYHTTVWKLIGLVWFNGIWTTVVYLMSNAVYIYIYIYIYIYSFWPDIGLAVRVFANRPGDLGSIPGRVIPKTQKMVLDASLLNTQHYKVRIKGKVEQSRERSSALPYTLV